VDARGWALRSSGAECGKKLNKYDESSQQSLIVPPSVLAVRRSGSDVRLIKRAHKSTRWDLLRPLVLVPTEQKVNRRDLSTRTILALDWGTLYRTIRTKDAAIAGFGAKHRLAASAFIEDLAGVSWHRLAFGEAANRAYQHGFQKKVAHARISMTSETLNSL
jgi:hypothetical protein